MMPRGAEYEAIKAELEEAQQKDSQIADPETDAQLPEEAQEQQQEQVEEQAGEEQGEIHALNEIPELLGITPEQFYSLRLNLANSGDGQVEGKTLGEIKDQIQQFEAQQRDLEAQRAQLDQQKQEFQQRIQQTVQQQQAASKEEMEAARLLMAIDGQLKVSEDRWKELEASNPGAVALERQKFQQAREAATAQLQQARMKGQQQQQMAYQQWMQRQNDTLTKAIPDWSNPEKRTAMQTEIREYAAKRGWTEQDLGRIDARQVLLLRDALELEKMKAEGAKAFEQVSKKAPVIPRSTRNTAKQIDKARIAELEQRALQTGRASDQLAAARAILGKT